MRLTYIIDGHNLIPKIPGIRLADEDDENQLIELLQEYCRLTRHNVEVFFDGAPPAARSKAGGGLVHVHFIQKGITADSAIIQFVSSKGKGARNLIVVSSDHRVQNETRIFGSSILSSEQFSTELVQALSRKAEKSKKEPPPMSEHEIKQWLSLFDKKDE